MDISIFMSEISNIVNEVGLLSRKDDESSNRSGTSQAIASILTMLKSGGEVASETSKSYLLTIKRALIAGTSVQMRVGVSILLQD